jgi:long-chain fatty acid transport protein
MNVTTRRATASLLAVGLFAISSAALATNGYFTHGVGTQSKGMAGTGIGSNANMGAVMSVSNPALGVFAGDRWEAGISVFSPRRSYEAFETSQPFPGAPIDLGPLNPGLGTCNPADPDFNPAACMPSHTIDTGKIDSGSEYFPIPYAAKNWSLEGDANITAAFYGRGGMNTNWNDPNAGATSYFCGGDPFAGEPPVSGTGPYCADRTSSADGSIGGTAGVNLMQAFLAVNYSNKVNENFAWGAGPVFAVQMFEARGIATFAPITESFAESPSPFPIQAAPNLTNNDADTSYGFGFAAGLWWAMSDTVSLGLAYQSRMYMSEFDDYADLFAEDGDFDIPSSIKVGLSVMASEQLRVNFDIEHTAYGEVDSIANPMSNMLQCGSPALPPAFPFGGSDNESCLGGDNGPGFGWEDMTTYKLGFEWTQNETNTWRFGYSYGEQPIQEADVLFNILAPGVMEQHITFGLTRQMANGSELNFSFMYAPENSVTGPSFFDPGPDFQSPQLIELTMSQLEFEVSYSF